LWPRARSRPTIILAVCSWNASARFLFIHSQFRSHITWTTKKKPTIYGFHIWSTRGAGDLQSQKYYGDACDAQSIGVKQKIAKVRAVKKSSKWQKKKPQKTPIYGAGGRKISQKQYRIITKRDKNRTKKKKTTSIQ